MSDSMPDIVWLTRPSDFFTEDQQWDTEPRKDRVMPFINVNGTTMKAILDALNDVTKALEGFVDTNKKIREPYGTPLSAYDRASDLLSKVNLDNVNENLSIFSEKPGV